MNIFWRKKIYWILFFIVIFLLLLNNSFHYLDSDLGWHLQVGHQIITTKQVPHINTYNYTLQNVRWVDHEWLINVISYAIYSKLNYFVLNIFFALLIILTLILLLKNLHFYIKHINYFLFTLLTSIGYFAMTPHLGIRMQEITLLFLVILLIILNYYQKIKTKKQILIFSFILIFLFYLWANIHAGFLIGIFILFFWTAIKFLETILEKKQIFYFLNFDKILNIKKIGIFFAFSIIATSATLLTPYKLELYTFLFGYKNNSYMTIISEWLPQNYFPLNYWQFIYLAILISVIFLYLYKSIIQKNTKYKIDLWLFASTLLFTVLAFKSRRHFPLLFIVSFPLIYKFLSTFLNLKKTSYNFLPKNKYLKNLIIFFLSACYLVLSTIIIYRTHFTNKPFASFCNQYPCQAVNFLKNNSKYADLKIFNQYQWGGYLIWVWPEKKLFIDGRLPQYKFADHTILEEYREFSDKNKIEKKLNQYNIQTILILRNNQIKTKWIDKFFFPKINNHIDNVYSPGKKLLDNSKNWQLIYSDNISLIYVRK